MKRATDVFAVLTAAVAAVAFACAPARAAGITGGATVATLRGDDVEIDLDLDSSRNGYSAGIYFSAFDYIQVPFLFKMTSATRRRPGLGLFFGPYFAFNLEAEVTSDVGGVPVTTDIKDLVRDTDVGAIVGLSLDAEYWSLDIRYTHGFERIFEDNSLDVRNGALSVMLGISF